MHQMVHGVAPSYLRDLLRQHDRILPGREFDRIPPLARSMTHHSAFIPSTVRDWNNLPYPLKSNANIQSFKRNLHDLGRFARKKPNPFYLMGRRSINIALSQIRMECSDLNSHKAKRGLTANKACACGHNNETSSHYFLNCPLYANERGVLRAELGALMTKQCLLHGNREDPRKNKLIIASVSKYICSTKRFVGKIR